jgi:hypothetical protein
MRLNPGGLDRVNDDETIGKPAQPVGAAKSSASNPSKIALFFSPLPSSGHVLRTAATYNTDTVGELIFQPEYRLRKTK